MTQHNAEYNDERKNKGLGFIPNPLPMKKKARMNSGNFEISQKELLPEPATSDAATYATSDSQIRKTAAPHFSRNSEISSPMPISTSSSSTTPMPMPVDLEQLPDRGTWQELPMSTTQPFRPFQRSTSWQSLSEPLELKKTKKPMIKNPLRHIQRLKRKDPAGLKFGGGLPGTRRLIGERLLERLTPNTNPVVAEGRRFTDFSDSPVPMQVDGNEPTVEAPPPPTEPRTRSREDETQNNSRRRVRRKTHKDDLEPYTDDMFAHLTAEDIPDWNTDDLLVGNDADLPPEARRCPVDVRKMIRAAHNNLGHPSNHSLVRLMKTAKVHPDMIAYARHMKCPTCRRRQAPSRVPRVSLPYRPTRFNAVVGLDLKWVKDSKGDTYYLLNILDLATAFNVCCVITNKRPSTVAQAFKQYWITWAGTPEKVTADKGTEYYTDFQAMLTDLGIQYRLVPVEAPWQHGMVERHGQVLGDIVQAVIIENTVKGEKEMQDMTLHVCMAKNRRPGRTGYSPRSLVFGIDERLVASGLNHYLEVPDDASIAAAQNDPTFQRSMQFRKSAMISLINLDHSEKWSDAIKFPSRKSESAMFLPGHQVFFWKKAQTASNLKGKRARLPERWYGPGVIIGHEWDQTAARDSYWVSYGGKCFLVAGTHLRHAEFEECLVHEKFVEELKKAFENVQTTTFDYVDLRRDQFVDPADMVDSVVHGNGNAEARATMSEQERTGLLSQMREYAPTSGIIFPRTSHARASSSTEPNPVEATPLPRRSRTPHEPDAEVTPEVDPMLQTPAPARRSMSPVPDDTHDNLYTNTKPKEKDSYRCFTLRGNNSVFIVNEVSNDCFFLKWKTFNKLQRKGKELDPKYFNDKEKAAFAKSDAKEWQSFIDTGAVVVIPPEEATRIPSKRIFQRAMRYVRTNKNKEEDAELLAKSRIVTPGDVDPDGEIAVEDGGFRTDAPTCPQIAFHLLCSQSVLKKRRLGTFDCKTAFLTGKEHDRDIYCRPPKEGLPGVPPGSLLKLVKGAYGLREAPRLWYLRAREILMEAGFEEMNTAKACFTLHDRSGPEPVNVGLLVLHVDDAAFSGEGPMFEKAMQHLRKKFTIGKEEYDDFTFLGRRVKQNKDFSIEIDQHDYVKALTKVAISRERRSKPKEKLTAKELHDYRSIVGQLAWPARESMPQISYDVSDLQQKVAESTVGDLVHANNVMNAAKRQAHQGQKILFQQLGEDVRLEVQHSDKTRDKARGKIKRLPVGLGMAAVHDASFMGQPKEGSQSAYCLMLCSTKLYEGKARTHLLDWGSGKIHRKMRSTLAAEAASAAKAFDKGAYTRVMLYEIENGYKHKWESLDADDCDLRNYWSAMCKSIPFALGTDCKSLYDVCTKQGSMPEERRVALDLIDVRESIEEMGDQIRWIPTDHMLVDCMTKHMPPDAMLSYLKNMEYAFKYDDVIRQTKREIQKARKAIRDANKPVVPLPEKDETYDEYEEQGVNIVQNYDLYLPMFRFLYQPKEVKLVQYVGNYVQLKKEIGFRKAYERVVNEVCI